jgi:DNA-binding XRE family transcriptional regulator
MARKFNELDAVKAIDSDPVRSARVAEYGRAIDDALALAELRRDRDLTQSDVAKVLGVTQVNVSRIERANDLYVSTLSDYVTALGGELELRAVFHEEDEVVPLIVERH